MLGGGGECIYSTPQTTTTKNTQFLNTYAGGGVYLLHPPNHNNKNTQFSNTYPSGIRMLGGSVSTPPPKPQQQKHSILEYVSVWNTYAGGGVYLLHPPNNNNKKHSILEYISVSNTYAGGGGASIYRPAMAQTAQEQCSVRCSFSTHCLLLWRMHRHICFVFGILSPM